MKDPVARSVTDCNQKNAPETTVTVEKTKRVNGGNGKDVTTEQKTKKAKKAPKILTPETLPSLNQPQALTTNNVKSSLDLIVAYMTMHKETPKWHYVERPQGGAVPYADHEDRVVLWAQSNEIKKELSSARGMRAAYNTIQQNAYQRLTHEIAEKITAPHQSNCTFEDIACITELSELDQLCLKWWMADRKRMLLDIANGKQIITNQIPMPIFHSKLQKTGKSYFVSELCKPFEALCDVKDIDEVQDQFAIKQWGTLLIANFDEMAGLEKTDMNKLKKWAYQTVFSRRKIQSDLQQRIIKVTGGIGSSNDPIADIVWDTSGTRRFKQVDVATDGTLIKAASSLQFIDIWRSIDESLTLTEEQQDLIYKQQDEERRKDKVELWYDDVGQRDLYGYSTFTDSKGIKASKLYENFKEWCLENGEKTITNALFGRRLMERYKDKLDKPPRNDGAYYVLKPSEVERIKALKEKNKNSA